MNGYYAQGVSVSTATLPHGWRDRLVLVESQSTQPGRGYALDPHDCVVSKLVAGREKDHAFANALLETRLIDPAIIAHPRCGSSGHAAPQALDRHVHLRGLIHNASASNRCSGSRSASGSTPAREASLPSPARSGHTCTHGL